MHMRRGKTVGDTARKRLPARRGERPREKPNLPTPPSCTSSLQNRDQVSVSFKSPSPWHFAMVALASQYTCDSSHLSFRGYRSPICRRDGFPRSWPHRVDLGGPLGSRTTKHQTVCCPWEPRSRPGLERIWAQTLAKHLPPA